MKKVLLKAITFSIFSTGFMMAADSASNKIEGLVSIDSIELMRKSKEGQRLAEKIQKDVEEFQTSVQKAQKELSDFQETVTKQAKVLSKEALEEKGEKLVRMKKTAERDLSDREESLKAKIQKQQMFLREKQMTVASKVFEDKNWGLMVDKNTPGVLFVSKAIDKTDEILKAVDDSFDKEVVKTLVEKKTQEQKDALSKAQATEKKA